MGANNTATPHITLFRISPSLSFNPQPSYRRRPARP
jgi:hypothetical protein